MGIILRGDFESGSLEVYRFLSLCVLLWMCLYYLAYGFLSKELTQGKVRETNRQSTNPNISAR